MNRFLLNTRHILYRFKTKVFVTSRLGEIVRFLAWKDLQMGRGLRVIFKESHNAFKNYSLKNVSNAALLKRFQQENEQWAFQDDVVYEIKENIYLEPEYSLGIVKPNFFITQTRSKAHYHVIPKLKYSFFNPKITKCIEIPQLIHFDGYAGRNLYHFIDDALNPLLVALTSGVVPKDLPILVHSRIYNLPFFKYFQKLPILQNCNWLVQGEDEWIQTKMMYKGSSSHVTWKFLYDELGRSTPKNAHRRIFLNRKPQFQRVINNSSEVEAVLKKYDFETVYAEDLTYEEQAKLFSEIKFLVAIHGAGVSNLIHSDLPHVGLLELFSADLLNPHFYWVFEQIGLNYYDGVVGSSFDVNWNFSINIDEFEASLSKMVANG